MYSRRRTKKLAGPFRKEPASFNFQLFPLHRGRGLACDVIDNAVDPFHFIYDPHRDLIQDLIGDPGPVGSHKIIGRDCPERQRVVIRPSVPHDAHRAGVGEDSEVLVQVSGLAGPGDLIPENKIRLPQRIGFFLCDRSDDPDGKPLMRTASARL